MDENEKTLYTKFSEWWGDAPFGEGIARAAFLAGAAIQREIDAGQKPKRFRCHVDVDADGALGLEPYPTCVWDSGSPSDCNIANKGIKRDDCKHWREY